MASCVRNIHAKNNQNMTIGFKVTVENVGGPSFLRHSVVLQSITSMLSTNKFVIVYSLDLSKAFDSVRHSTLLSRTAFD